MEIFLGYMCFLKEVVKENKNFDFMHFSKFELWYEIFKIREILGFFD